MKNGKGWLVAGFLLLTGLVGLCACGCDDEPTRSHRQTPQNPKDYPVYFCNSLNSTLWIFHPLTQQLDSVVVPYAGEMRGVTVSADGRLLYFAQEDRVLVVTADSLDLVKELPYGARWGTSISPDNGLLAIMGRQICILRTCDWSVAYTDSTELDAGVFSKDSRTFYASSVEEATGYNRLYWVDPAESTSVLHQKEFQNHVTHIQPTPRWHQAADVPSLAFLVLQHRGGFNSL